MSLIANTVLGEFGNRWRGGVINRSFNRYSYCVHCEIIIFYKYGVRICGLFLKIKTRHFFVRSLSPCYCATNVHHVVNVVQRVFMTLPTTCCLSYLYRSEPLQNNCSHDD